MNEQTEEECGRSGENFRSQPEEHLDVVVGRGALDRFADVRFEESVELIPRRGVDAGEDELRDFEILISHSNEEGGESISTLVIWVSAVLQKQRGHVLVVLSGGDVQGRVEVGVLAVSIHAAPKKKKGDRFVLTLDGQMKRRVPIAVTLLFQI